MITTPHLYQHVTDVVFGRYVTEHVTASTSVNDAKLDPAPAITQHEGNALHYAVGYFCRHLRKKIEHSTKHKLKEKMVLCLMALTKDRPEEESKHVSSEEWTLMIDKGGL